MAGHNNRQWIVMVGLAYGAESIWPADGAGNIGIRAGLAIGNSQ
jgi:hypothetical protein